MSLKGMEAYADRMKEPDSAGPGPVTVLTVRDPGVLAVAQSLLDDAGIPYFAKSENSANVTPFLIWVELQVEPDDAEEAGTPVGDLSQTGGKTRRWRNRSTVKGAHGA